MLRSSQVALLVIHAFLSVCTDPTAGLVFLPGLDGLPDLNIAKICSSIYRCPGCTATAPVTASTTGRPYTEFNEDYIGNLALQVHGVTVVSFKRRRATAFLLKTAILTVPGDIVETGVFTGGSGILMTKILKDWDLCGRSYWGYDSFQGLPTPVNEDLKGEGLIGLGGGYAAGLQQVKANFKAHGVDDASIVKLIPGWFNETLPVSTVKYIAFLRLDGDLFTSTRDGLIHLYHKVVPGGIIYVDDYGSFNGCREAVDRFRVANGISAPLRWVREEDKSVEAVWWRKPIATGTGGGGGGNRRQRAGREARGKLP